MEHQHGPPIHLTGLFTPGRLGCKRHDPTYGVPERARGPYRDGTAERVAPGHCVARTAARREVDGCAHVDRAGVEVVRSAVADPQGADPSFRECLAELVVQPTCRAEESAHRAAAGHDDVLGITSAVP